MRKKWLVKKPNPQQQVVLSNALHIHPIVSQLLINRAMDRVDLARDFLYGTVRDLHDPLLLKDMDVAVRRIQRANEKKETVMVFGDYDVDGVTACAIVTHALRRMGLHVITHIPHRMTDGYGLNHTIAKQAKEQGVSLMITVDCGISAIDEVDALNAQGIEVVVVDHHEPLKDRLPNAFAVIDPKRQDCPYPFGGLAAAALAYKLAQALLGVDHTDDLDLVALGTIADVVPLYGENRILVKEGLPRIAQTKNAGLRALIKAARIEGKKLTPRHVGFILAPRINAMGRIDSAERSLDLLLTQDPREASRMAEMLETYNRERQKKQGDIVTEALRLVEEEINFKTDRVIVLAQEGWHRGVVGIVAARIVETFYRPCIILSIEDGVGVGSARSIEGFHLFEALTQCADLLENFGGHEHAAGLTIKEENIERFKVRINEIAHQELSAEDLVPCLTLDGEIPLNEITMDLVSLINKLEPYGEGNPEPVFCSRGVTVKSAPVILGRGTLKFWVTDGCSIFSVVGFGMEAYRPLVEQGRQIDIAYKLSIDDWNKKPEVQLELKDIRET